MFIKSHNCRILINTLIMSLLKWNEKYWISFFFFFREEKIIVPTTCIDSRDVGRGVGSTIMYRLCTWQTHIHTHSKSTEISCTVAKHLSAFSLSSTYHLYMHLFVTLDFQSKTRQQALSLYNKNREKVYHFLSDPLPTLSASSTFQFLLENIKRLSVGESERN